MSNRGRLSTLALLALAAAAATACSSAAAGNQPVTITRAESLISGCEKVGEIRAEDARNADQVTTELGAAARAKKANTVLLTDSEGTRGVAYRCGMPTATSSAPATGR
jgi:hypothetical protein